MAKKVTPGELSAVLERELKVYTEGVIQRVNQAGAAAVKKLVALTKSTAPRGARGKFRRSITSGVTKEIKRGNTYTWYVKGKEYRLTHLLVHGHVTKNGGRTKANPFLKNALDVVLPEYEDAVKEAVKSD